MGTLTADCPRLDSHCPHKLATSCRLTATPNCCACADQRAHSSAYRVYVDGVGFVHRGTRWQSYCWFCKEFWTNRLASTDPPLEPSQTRIPVFPDQTEFLARWFEFHQGYRNVRQPDGTETCIAVIGEPLDQVSPGFLPRTLDQLRAGRRNDHLRVENRFQRQRLPSEEAVTQPEQPHQTIEAALDILLNEVAEEQPSDGSRPAVSATEVETTNRPRRQPRRQTQEGSRPSRALERFRRIFGTREDVQRDDYESPISNMYNRAYTRYRQAEARREAGNTTVPPLESLTPQERTEIEDQIVWGVIHDSRRAQQAEHSSQGHLPAQHHSHERNDRPVPLPIPEGAGSSATSFSSMPPLPGTLAHIQNRNMAWMLQIGERPELPRNLSIDIQHPTATLDQPSRPPPLTDAEMTKDMSCQVCYCQLANIAVLPCGHMIMCQWCADVVIPVRHGHIPGRNAKCPMCRKAVKQRVKIYIS